jgi:hypothetical protein
LWTEEQLRAMIGKRPKRVAVKPPKFYLKDRGGWYLERKRITEDVCNTTWTHIRQEARAFTKYTTAALTANRLNLEREKETIEVIRVD